MTEPQGPQPAENPQPARDPRFPEFHAPGQQPAVPQPGVPQPDPGQPYFPPPAGPADSPVFPGVPQAAAVSQPAPAVAEQVGRGVLFSLLAIVVGAVLAAVLYQFGYIASITSFLMVAAAGWLYAKGAGTAPRAGLPAFIIVVVAGVIVSLLAMLGARLYSELATDYPTATPGEIIPVVFDNLFYPPIWQVFAMDALIFVGFAALGTWGTLRQLRRQTTA